MNEEMISFEESRNTIELKNYYIILQSNNKKQLAYYKNKFKGKKLNKQFSYNSNENKDFLSIGEIKKLINIQKINKS